MIKLLLISDTVSSNKSTSTDQGAKSLYRVLKLYANRAVPSGFWLGGGEIKYLGPLPFGGPSFPETKKFLPENLGREGDPKFFSNTRFT
jgi:hypothetical protein